MHEKLFDSILHKNIFLICLFVHRKKNIQMKSVSCLIINIKICPVHVIFDLKGDQC